VTAGVNPAFRSTWLFSMTQNRVTVDTTILAFAGVSLLLAVTPGPDMAVVTKNALAHGRRGVILTTTGIALALSIWVTATAFGLSAVVRDSGELLLVLKIAGAAYLGYLGVRTLIDSRKRPADLIAGTPPAAPAHVIFRQGFLSALSNPKLGVFFVTFLPQFVAPGQALLPRLLLLGLIFATIGWTWMNVYGFLVTRIRDFITAPRVRQWMERVTGVVLLGFGVRLAVERF
jgi:threonine/homoserine/homoserine lactone efflux protein